MIDSDAQLEAENRALRDELAALEGRRDDLRGERDKFKDLYEWAPDMCVSIDIAGATIVECNARILEELGYERPELIGNSILSIIHPRDRSPTAERLGQLVDAGELRDVELRLLRRDGSSVFTRLNVTTRHDPEGTILYARCVARDISVRKAAEDALVLSEARLRSLTETLNVVPWQMTARLTDAPDRPVGSPTGRKVEYHVVYIGPQFETIFGYPASRWYDDGGWAELIHPEDRAAVVNRAGQRLDAPGSYRDEWRLIGADGKEAWVLQLVSIIIEPDGRRVLSGVLVDISERKAREAAQARLMEELGHRVKNSFATVEAVLDRTLATSDDISTFLTTFRGRIGALAAIHNAMARSDWESVDLLELVGSSLAPFGESPRVRAEGAPVRVTVDVARSLGMVLHELATNAVKYGALSIGPGTVAVSWREEERNAGSVLCLDWIEAGGPPVREPRHRGYGLRLIETFVPYELGGKTSIHWAESGLCCAIEFAMGDPDQRAQPSQGVG